MGGINLDLFRQVDQAHGAGPGLIQSGRQYASRVAQEAKKIRESLKAINSLQAMKDSGLKVISHSFLFYYYYVKNSFHVSYESIDGSK